MTPSRLDIRAPDRAYCPPDLHEEFRGHRIEPHARKFTRAFSDKYWEMGIVKFIPLEDLTTSMQY